MELEYAHSYRRKNPQHLYVGAQYLYVSNNQGRTWKRISGDLTTNDLKTESGRKWRFKCR